MVVLASSGGAGRLFFAVNAKFVCYLTNLTESPITRESRLKCPFPFGSRTDSDLFPLPSRA